MLFTLFTRHKSIMVKVIIISADDITGMTLFSMKNNLGYDEEVIKFNQYIFFKLSLLGSFGVLENCRSAG